MAHPGAVVGLSSTPCLVFFFSSSLQTHRDVQDHLYHLKSPGLPSESFAGSCPLTQKNGVHRWLVEKEDGEEDDGAEAGPILPGSCWFIF